MKNEIIELVKAGNTAGLRAYELEFGEDWRRVTLNKNGDTACILACRLGHVELLELFDSSDLERRNVEGKRSLHEAVQYNHTECVKYLISRNVCIDCLKRADWTPLMLSCTRDDSEMVRCLLDAGANPSIRNKDGWNSLHIAAREGHVEIMRDLLSVDPNAYLSISNNGRTALHTAALHGRVSAVHLLISLPYYQQHITQTTPFMTQTTPLMTGAMPLMTQTTPLMTDRCGATPLMTDRCEATPLMTDRCEATPLMTDRCEATPLMTDRCGATPLMDAVRGDHAEVVEMLMKRFQHHPQMRADFCDGSGRQLLHIASECASIQCICYLIEQCHVDPSPLTCHTLDSPLHCAAREGHVGVARLLVKLNTQLSLVNAKGRTALDVARLNKRTECEQILLQYTDCEQSEIQCTDCEQCTVPPC